ncbi:hypothetical protein ACMFMG_004334 [Clarireedia jacksonii]
MERNAVLAPPRGTAATSSIVTDVLSFSGPGDGACIASKISTSTSTSSASASASPSTQSSSACIRSDAVAAAAWQVPPTAESIAPAFRGPLHPGGDPIRSRGDSCAQCMEGAAAEEEEGKDAPGGGAGADEGSGCGCHGGGFAGERDSGGGVAGRGWPGDWDWE